MAEHPDKQALTPETPARRDMAPDGGLAPAICVPPAAYLKLVDRTRKAVAIAMAVFGLAFVVCARRDDYLTGVLREEPGIWAAEARVLGIGVLVCIAATLALIVEYLARPTGARSFSLRSLFARFLLITVASVAICLTMAWAYGEEQAIGAVTGVFLLLAAIREHRWPRAILGVLAAIVLGQTLWSTLSAYQYASRHAEEIVAAGCELADQIPRADYHAHDRTALGTSWTADLFGQEIDPSDPRVPGVLRKLGAQRIWVDEERVAVYVGGDTELQICRQPHPTKVSGPVWAPQWKGSTRFTDRLWSNVY